MDWQLYALDLAHGWKVWEFAHNKPVISSPAVGDGKVFVGSVDGILYAVDASSGRERWRFQTEGQITSSPAYANDAVYFGGIDGKVYSLDAKTGLTALEFPDWRVGAIVALCARWCGLYRVNGSSRLCIQGLIYLSLSI